MGPKLFSALHPFLYDCRGLILLCRGRQHHHTWWTFLACACHARVPCQRDKSKAALWNVLQWARQTPGGSRNLSVNWSIRGYDKDNSSSLLLTLVGAGQHQVCFWTSLRLNTKSWGICCMPLPSICPSPQAICFVIFETASTLIWRPGGHGFLYFV